MSTQTADKKKQGSKLITRFSLVVIVLILLNFVSSKWFTKWDLTADKRYSNTEATQQLLKELKGHVNVTVFLTGDKLPAAFKSLANGTEELLKTFANESKRKVSYQFADPTKDENAAKTLEEYRMTGFPVTINDAGGMEQRMVFPWALVTFIPEHGGDARHMPVMLQESNSLVLNKQILLRSEMMLEYNLGNAIRLLAKGSNDMIGYIVGNDEAMPPAMISLARNAGLAGYGMDTINLQLQTSISNHYKALLILQPKKEFSDIDLFKIDQYIMNGGRVLFALDQTLASIDSFTKEPTFTATANDVNINKILFPYGIRVNNDIVQDASNNAGIPVAINGEAQPQMFSWPYFPVLEGNDALPLTKNLQGVLSRFPSSIDFNKNNDVKVEKKALLTTSIYSRTLGLPNVVMYNQSIMEEPNHSLFTKKNVIVAALLQGSFVSPFAQQQSDDLLQFIDKNNIIVKNQSDAQGKIIVLSDADILLNELSKEGPTEMGVYRFRQEYKFDNASFFQNCITYLVDDNNLLEARTKTYQSRILDPKRVKDERNKWQLIAIGIPVILVGILAVIYTAARKRRYGRKM
jgi:ABC-2 type transport system permease protein